jgi:serine/threonine protein kinase
MTTPRPLGSRYELLDLLGTGAMGEVWRARDRESDRELAAKVLRAEYARDTEIVTRFIQERSILMGLRHPNIVAVHDLVVEGERLGIIMELVDGGDLRGRLRATGTLHRRDAVTATCSVLDALAEAHAQGCLHRDVKPDNVLLTGTIGEPGAVKLSDFSIARLAQESTVMATGLLGTPGYMPPELFVHGQFSAASDVYAAGVLLYELLAGRTPFAGSGTAHTIGNRHVSAEPPRIPVEDELWHVVATMLSKDPRVRLTAADTAAVLRELPDELLDRPSLPVQQHPDSFGPALHTALRPSPIRVQDPPSELDPGVTNLHAGREPSSTAAPLAGSGEVVAFAPTAGVAADEVTSVGRAAPVHHAPVLTPGAVAEEPRTRRRWVPWVVGGLVLAALAGGGVAVAQGGDDEAEDPGEQNAAAGTLGVITGGVPGNPLPTGLAVDRDVVYDPATGQAELTLRYSTQDAPLTGPFLEVIPAVDDTQQCPGVAWTGRDQLPNIQRTTGIDTPCAFAVEVGTIAPDSSTEVTATVDIDLGADTDAVRAWLERAQQLTQQSLEDDGVTSGAYPAQRLADVRVEVQSGITAETSNVQVQLVPVWLDGSEDLTQALYNSTSTGAATGALDQVAGGLSGVTLRESCGGALSIVNQRQVSVLRPAEDCVVEAEVGNFDVASAPFTISRLGG